MKDVSRRDFLKYVGVGALGLVVRPSLVSALGRRFSLPVDGSDVVQCVHDGATNGSTIVEPVVQMMMDESIMALAGIRDVGEAWKSVFPGISATSVIGLKVNCASSACPSNPEVVNCIINGLICMDFGGSLFKKNNAIVYERTDSELTAAGYTLYAGNDPETLRCVGTNHSGFGYDSGVTFNVNGYNTHPSVILSQMCDYVIDVPVLKTHSLANVTLNLKNHYGSVSNASGLQHSSGCSPAIPSLNQQIRDVVTPNNIQRLFVIDGLFGMYSGGPGGSPNFNPKMILMSKDPVACDYQGQNVINIERDKHGLGALNAAQITTAAQPPYSLGTTEVNLIELNNVGVREPGRSLPGGGAFDVTPDPVRDHATVTFAVSRPGRVSLELLNAAGRSEACLFAGTLDKGRHRVDWRAERRLVAGTYFLRLKNAGSTQVCKVAVLGR